MSALAPATAHGATTPEKTNKQFPFLKLPGEIRNQIYALLLTNTVPVHTRPYRQWTGRQPQTSDMCVAILQVSKQVHAESYPLLYSLNRYQAHSQYLTALPFLIDSCRPLTSSRYIKMIRRFHICVRLDCDPYWTRSALKESFCGLDELTVEAWQASYGTSGYKVLEPFMDVRRVKRARVEGSIQWDFAAWLEKVMQSNEDDEVFVWNGAAWDAWIHGNR